MTNETIVIPDLGGAESVDVIEICVKVGDQVKLEDSLIVVESDKATIEVPSPFEGEVSSISLSVGDSVKEGDSIVTLTLPTSLPEQDLVDGPANGSASVKPEHPQQQPQQQQPKEQLQPQRNEEQQSTTVSVPDIGGSENVEIIRTIYSN